ncbi:MAG: hypothetical protein IT323_03350 [Anaerolineae bacterium]|nr:hypothetical protein [Anaerolineae bacterium]
MTDRRSNIPPDDDSDPESIPLPKPPPWMTAIPAPDEPDSPQKPAWRGEKRAGALEPPRPPAWLAPADPNRDANAAPTTAPPPTPSTPAPSSSTPMVVPDRHLREEQPLSAPIRDDEDEDEIEAEPAEDEWEDALEDEDDDEEAGLFVDPAFVYIVVMLVTALGTNSLASDVRYTLLWSVLALTGAAAFIIDRLPLDRPDPRDVLTGVAYGLIIGLPLLIIGRAPLRLLSEAMFGRLDNVAVFQAAVFVMPFAESLFFRGAFQFSRGMVAASVAGGAWTVLLFLPALNVSQFPFVALVIGLAFFFITFVYGTLAERLGLVSAWACQITINVLVLFAARLV